MADVRSLLRQQRAARRITHPHAAYSDAGKLLCTVCREQIKTELLWEVHIMSPGHRERLEKLEESNTESGLEKGSNKRKHEDEDMEDASQTDEAEDGSRKKRSRQETTEADKQGHPQDKRGEAVQVDRDDTKTPPARGQHNTPPMVRRSSGTPSQGVEMQIPSRPATPVAVRTEATRTRSSSNVGDVRSPLSQPSGGPPPVAGFAAPSAATAPGKASAALATATATAAATAAATAGAPASTSGDGLGDVLEDEWAAFEADLLKNNNDSRAAPPPIAAPDDAVISAPAMTAGELAAQSVEEEQAKRRAAADAELDDEKEDAARALETEFEDMEELEARVRRLKERREALRNRLGSESVPADAAPEKPNGEVKSEAKGKENAQDGESEDDDDDEDDEDEDDWAGFRFRR